MPPMWFDAHLDLACLAVCGRDMTLPLDSLDPAAKPYPPPAVTLPSLAEGHVRLALATIFTETLDALPTGGHLGPEQYVMGDTDRAARLGRAQLEAYLTWRDMGLVSLNLAECFRTDPGVGELRGGMGVAEVIREPIGARIEKLTKKPGPLRIGLLIEGADPVRSPDELGWWKQQGAVAVGLAWARASCYAAGNMTPTDQDRGLTDLGRAMVAEIDRLSLVHDLSHLSDRAMDELLSRTGRTVMASHSNCRAINDPTGANQRHFRDDSIREIVRRGGVIGLNLFARFLRPHGPFEGEGRPTISDAVRHVEHICELVGHRRAVGLGSDMDGGFGANAMCAEITRPAHLSRLAEALSARGWSDADVESFAWRNWCEFWDRAMNSVANRAAARYT